MDLTSGVQFLAGAGILSLHHHIQTGSGTHPAMSTRDSLPGGKTWPLTSNQCQG